MHPNMETLNALREVNTTLLKAGLVDTHPDISGECDRARQPVIEAIRKLDPDSAANPAPEELDVDAFHAAATGAGQAVVDKITGG